eukprot:TRINITY_DN2494_c0_g1_i3.p1 TRINITY_DN2494_c0_g1~~TRINITY_DN2494_c0_g1_i3.p1  ORF type:complete len:111 (-),score=21.54 TRINITY_DN2494_c0_g1_i3:83-415(-)
MHHWCLAVLRMKEQKIEYFDSLGGHNQACVESLQRYVTGVLVTNQKESSQWTIVSLGTKVPQQDNPNDCGVFVCKFADYCSREQDFNFSQQDIPFFRTQMVLQIFQSQLK